MVSQRDKAPTNALVVQAVRSCTDRKIPYLVYSNFAYGKKQKDSLSDFKERNGFQKIDVPRYFVPITPLGSAAIKFGLQHPLTSKLPEPLMVKLREMRNNWYMRKLQGFQEMCLRPILFWTKQSPCLFDAGRLKKWRDLQGDC